MIATNPQEVLDGVLLSDGSLYINSSIRNARFRINLSGSKHIDWLNAIKEALALLGVFVSPQYPELEQKLSSFGKLYTEARLQSRCHPALTVERHRWYKRCYDNKIHKVVPADLVLSPCSIAHWFMGDGNSRKYGVTVPVYISTEAYDVSSVKVLENQLHNFGIKTGRGIKSPKPMFGAGVLISVLQKSVNAFMDIVEPYILPSYAYKIKRKD